MVDEYGAYLHVKDGRFQLIVREGKEQKVKWDVAPVALEAIVFVTPGASISAAAIELANKYGIDLIFLKKDRPIARLLPATYGSTLKMWLCQLKAFRRHDVRLKLARLFVEGKIYNQRMVLMEYSRRLRGSTRVLKLNHAIERLSECLRALGLVKEINECINIEAQAANMYWSAIATLLPKELGFTRRLTKQEIRAGIRPDPFNIALNIGYAALRRVTWKAVFMAGLNPYIGFLHAPRAGRMSLVLDLMEEFRPISVDRPLITLARNKPSLLQQLAHESKEAITEVWRAIVNYMASSKPSHDSLIVAQARLLAQHLRGTANYKPYKSRW
ncbi:MAG: CRISPR-associated endonuclease Cas1 [Candidatus Nezhaarchaeales archaeon]